VLPISFSFAELSAPVAQQLSQTEVSTVIVMSGLGGLGAFVLVFVNIWDKFRRKPPLAEELLILKAEFAKSFATKEEFKEMLVLKSELAKSFATKEEFHSLESSIREDVRLLRDERRVSVARLHDKIEKECQSIRNTLSTELVALNRSLGRVEGSDS
jgi:hypothetical protein